MNPNPDLFAWIGEDELGSGEVGLKQCLMPCGLTPLVATKLEKVNQLPVMAAMQLQAMVGGKRLRLCRYVLVEELIVMEPRTK